MAFRHSLASMTEGIIPFLAGAVIGELSIGLLVCCAFGYRIIDIGPEHCTGVAALLVWIVYGMPLTIAATFVWQLAAFVLLWALCPFPLSARPRFDLLLLGGAAWVLTAGAIAANEKFGLTQLSAPIRLAVVAISPILMVTRDWSVDD
jgi:hypothetical protein